MDHCMKVHLSFAIGLAAALTASPALAAELVLTPRLHHIRLGSEREWSDFPEQAEAGELRLEFALPQGFTAKSLRVRHRDLKQAWSIKLNGQLVDKLPVDENDMRTYWNLPPAALREKENVLLVQGSGKAADDIWIGEVAVDERTRDALLHEAEVTVQVTDADSGKPLPCRLTVVDEHGALVSLGAKSDDHLAVRPGVIYTGDGQATFGLPAGKYTVYTGRGFEYEIDRATFEHKQGDKVDRQLKIRRSVPTAGYVSCDTHCHTFTYSKHGDATIAERMLTLAGEGLELPIATDHNVQIDYEPPAQAAGMRRYFTPVVGNEVTTRVGHFNVFPLKAGATPIDSTGADWAAVFGAIDQVGEPVVILNHARDIHSGYRPFGPDHHNGASGENLDGWTLRTNAMEIVNSSATQTDPWQLVHDWMAQLNYGRRLTPVGSSDCHDVSRFIIGQGRTYIHCDDSDPARIDTSKAIQAFRAGRVSVSMGLLAEIEVNGHGRPGDQIVARGTLDVRVRVLGPSWTRVDEVILFANGVPIERRKVSQEDSQTNPAGVLWQGQWTLAQPPHDVHLVAAAIGPGVTAPYWPIARSYQPASPEWKPYVLAVTGAVLVDADSHGMFESAREYAERLTDGAKGDLPVLMKRLAGFDEAVAIQAASILAAQGTSIVGEPLREALAVAAPQTRRGFQKFEDAWKQSVAARGGAQPAKP